MTEFTQEEINALTWVRSEPDPDNPRCVIYTIHGILAQGAEPKTKFKQGAEAVEEIRDFAALRPWCRPRPARRVAEAEP